jgi:hypothetical protein
VNDIEKVICTAMPDRNLPLQTQLSVGNLYDGPTVHNEKAYVDTSMGS